MEAHQVSFERVEGAQAFKLLGLFLKDLKNMGRKHNRSMAGAYRDDQDDIEDDKDEQPPPSEAKEDGDEEETQEATESPKESSKKEDQTSAPKVKSKLLILRELLWKHSTKKGSRETLNVNFALSKNVEDHPHYCVMITSFSDKLLHSLAKLPCQFPRGFPIIWVPGEYIQLFGFFPKFENDEREPIFIDDNEAKGTFDDFTTDVLPNGTTGVEIALKWSGFLGQFLVYRIGKPMFWTATAKNSISSKYSLEAARMFKPFIENSRKLVEFLVEKRAVLAAEILSKNDQTHGYPVYEETPVFTCLGTGFRAFWTNDEFCVQDNEDLSKFIAYDSNQSLMRFCEQFGLPHGPAYFISNAPPDCLAEKFFRELTLSRDFALLDIVETLIKKYAIETSRSALSHAKVVGNILEGLILFIQGSKKRQMIKFKFPAYTIRTMLLRGLIHSSGLNWIHSESLSQAKEWGLAWCLTSSGRRLWLDRFCRTALLALEQSDKGFPLDFDEAKPGLHIVLSDQVLRFPSAEVEGSMHKFLELLSLRFSHTVLIALGPIGSGKSSVAQKVADFLNSQGYSAVHIDGDHLGVGVENTLQLGAERSDFTRFCVHRAFLEGKVPVLSCGGGVLLGRNGKIALRAEFSKVFRTEDQVRVVCLIPAQGGVLNLSEVSSDEPVDLTCYNNKKLVEDAIKRRLKAGVWKKSGGSEESFIKQIYQRSKDNKKIASRLVLSADRVLTFPLITELDFDASGNLREISMDALRSIPLDAKSKPAHFTQIRLSAKVHEASPWIHHVTLKYDPLGVRTDRSFWAELDENFTGQTFDGFSVQLFEEVKSMEQSSNSSKKKNKNKALKSMEFIVIPTLFESAHVTKSPGCHLPQYCRDATIAVTEGQASISIPVQKSDKSITYSIPKRLSEYPLVKVEILGAFAVV